MLSRIKILLNMYRMIFHKRDKNLWIFGAWLGSKFADNSKYLFLKAIHEGINAVWITKNEEVYKKLKKRNLPVEMHNSEKGIRLQKKAGYAIYCVGPYDFDEQFLGGCIMIYLDHGVAMKKVLYDDTVTNKQPIVLRKMKDKIMRGPNFHKLYKLSTSSKLTPIYERAYGIKRRYIIESGNPRNDIFFTDEFEEESDFSFLSNKKIISYLPTHRREGNVCIDINSILDLESINKICEANNYLFVIKKHFYHKYEKTNLSKYNNIVDITQEEIDTQELLKHTDILITDYSSVYIDYLLLDRPIVFYNYDIDDYKMNDREMYFDYDTVTPGPKVQKKDEFTRIIKDICMGTGDRYALERLKCVELFFDGKKKACAKELIETIKGL